MSERRKVEVFSAGCRACDSVIEMVRRMACESCEVSVLDMKDDQVAARAVELGIRSVPAVVVDGELAGCCRSGGVTEEGLRASGVGQPRA